MGKWGCALAALALAAGLAEARQPPPLTLAEIDSWLQPDAVASDRYGESTFSSDSTQGLFDAEQAQFQRLLSPQVEAASGTPLPSAATAATSRLGLPGPSSLGGGTGFGIALTGADIISGRDSVMRASTDAGDLLGKSPLALGVSTQQRNPVVTDSRVRDERIGSAGASGSYWVPARIDLDTTLSKFDSRTLEQIAVIKGPYSALYGPGFEFVDVELIGSPRFEGGFQAHGRSLVDFKSNGEQWYGRQDVWGGDDLWGFRIGYGHGTGNDYRAGNGDLMPSSYKSRDVNLALGGDLTTNSSVELHYMRLDQTDVELAGQAFDIDVLKTDGYDLQYVLRDQRAFDLLLLEGWYNRTQLYGSAQRPGKRAQFPYYDQIMFTGQTDVDSISTGYRSAVTWGDADDTHLTAGTDLRYIQQQLNEVTTGTEDINFWIDANSPIPRSHSSNPGVFVQLSTPVAEQAAVTVGGRADWVSTNVTADPAALAAVGTAPAPLQLSAEEILGSGDFDQDDALGAGFVTLTGQVADGWQLAGSVGYAERAPNLTERYAVEPFMFVLQNGLNTVTGDPLLDKERRIQFDLRLARSGDYWRGQITGFHAWIRDYITFENMMTNANQTNLKFVNTDLATLIGCEGFVEMDLTDWLTPFATLDYVQGDDRTRNGSFATQQSNPLSGQPSTQSPGLARGFYSGVAGEAREPLPSILPLQSRIGARIGPHHSQQPWGVEIYARVADNQQRVAASLLESPTPGFTVWDARAYWGPREGVLLTAGVENFTDKTYREHLDFRSADGFQVLRPGVTFYFGGELNY
ncbi:MAG: TonB-dependent receptor [Planctomycetaceae bacterium]|nr:TonB-dependent receptor [Planctomycetaceae bacterium]